MKLQYLGDARDAFKWDLLHWICTRSSPPFTTLVFVPLLTRDVPGSNEGRTPHHRFNCRAFIRPFLVSLQEEPRTLDRISALGKLEPHRTFQVAVFARDRFIDAVARREDYWSGFDPSKLDDSVVFFDPDNGFETKTRRGSSWIRHSELKNLFARLPETSPAVVYQHRPHRTWDDEARLDGTKTAGVFTDLKKQIDYMDMVVAAYENDLAFVAMAANHATGRRINAAIKTYTDAHPVVEWRPLKLPPP
jgi:hypothetical protein